MGLVSSQVSQQVREESEIGAGALPAWWPPCLFAARTDSGLIFLFFEFRREVCQTSNADNVTSPNAILPTAIGHSQIYF